MRREKRCSHHNCTVFMRRQSLTKWPGGEKYEKSICNSCAPSYQRHHRKIAISKADKLESDCEGQEDHCPTKYESTYDSGTSLAKATNAFIITGSILAATGVVLTVVGHKKGKSKEHVKMKSTPLIGESTMGLAIYGSF